MAPLALVANFATGCTTCILIPNLTTRWRHLHLFHIWPLDGITCISCKHGHQMAPLELVTNLATRCHHLYWFQIWPLDDYLQIWPPDGTTCITNKFAHQTKSHALPDCLGLPYWHYQLVLTWYLHQPESHQLSLQNVLEWETTGPIDRTPGTPGSDKDMKELLNITKKKNKDSLWTTSS